MATHFALHPKSNTKGIKVEPSIMILLASMPNFFLFAYWRFK
jgi:hypothetical protein